MENHELSEDVKEWAALSVNQINAHKRKQCSKCYYFSKNSGGGSKSDYASLGTCDYIFLENKIRPCSPLHCIEKGVFKQNDRNRSRKEPLVLRGKV